MRKYFICLVLVAVLVPSAVAQDAPKADVHVGYALGFVDTGIGNETTNGLGFGLHVPFSDSLGGVFDLSVNSGSVEILTLNIGFSAQTYLGGIRYTKRGESSDVFFHVMGGMARFSVFGASASDAALGIGGGIDYRIKENLYYRVVQVDYIPIFASGETVNNIKIQTGLQFRF